MATGIYNYPQLKSDNFDNWLFRVTCLLEEKQLNNVINIEKESLKEEKLAEFVKQDAKARSLLVQCLSDKHLNIVKNCTTSRDMINVLKQAFQRKSVLSKLNLRRRLLTMKCQDSEKLEDYFNWFDSVVRELETIGNKIEEEDKICYLFTGLPSVYDTVITAIETVSQENLKLDFVKTRLLDEEIKIKSKEGVKEETETLFTIQCFKCGQQGHKSFGCRSNNSFMTRRGRSRGGNRRMTIRGGSTRGLSHIADSDSNELFIALSSEYLEPENEAETQFIIDSGATHHFIQMKYEKFMQNVEELKEKINIKIANGQILKASKKGILKVEIQDKIVDVEGLLVPGLSHNLLSVNKLIENGMTVTFSKGSVKVYGKKGTYYGEKKGKLHILKMKIINEDYECNYTSGRDLWHQRMGHLNRKGLSYLHLPYSKEICDDCMKNKSTRLPFQRILKPQSKCIGELIHTDIAGPTRTATNEGYRYYQTIIDDYSRFTKTYLLKNKSEAMNKLKEYIERTETEKGVKIKRIRCDNGGEFSSREFKNYCINKGISIEYSQPYSPQMNGRVERMNRTIYDKARTMLNAANLPLHLWGHAVITATFLINRSPSSAINFRIPADVYGQNKYMERIKVFGCKAWSMIIPKMDKLHNRARVVRMIGYVPNGYKLWDPNTDEVITSRDVRFDETDIQYKGQNEKKEVNEEKYQYNDNEETENEEGKDKEKKDRESSIENDEEQNIENEVEQPSDNQRYVTQRGRTVKTPEYLSEYDLNYAYCFMTEDEPIDYNDAINKGWETAIKNELDAHNKMKTWSETDLPEKKNIF